MSIAAAKRSDGGMLNLITGLTVLGIMLGCAKMIWASRQDKPDIKGMQVGLRISAGSMVVGLIAIFGLGWWIG